MSNEDARRVLSSLKAIKPSAAVPGSGYGVPGGSYGSGMSPLVASYAMPGMPYGERTYGTALPRDPREFLSGMFSPLSPIQPVAIDQPKPGFERPEPRDFEYPVSWNMPIGVPGSEGLKLASFANLRSIADIYSVARACIKLRIQEILGLEWDIIPTKDAEKNMRGSDSKHKDFQQRRGNAMDFWRNPDPNYGSFESWLSAVLEDILVIDALSLYMHPSRMRGKGLLGSNVAAVEIIAGETIRPLLDVSGGRPKPPNPAYQQYMYGVPRADLMSVIDNEDLPEGMTESMVAQYRGDQLLYLPYFRRSWTPYGFSPVEQALVPAMMGIQRQSWQLDTYSEGTVPAVFISAGDANATPNQLRELQDALNAMAGDPAWKHKIIVLPGGSKIDPMKPQALADAFDEIMMTQMCMAFDVMPMELGISPKVSTTQSPGAANQMAKASEKVNQRKALRPLLKWLKASVFDFVMQKVCGQDDMQFMWEGLEEGVDEESQVGLLIQEISFGLRSIDEARIQRGEQPWGLPMTSDPVYATPNGLMPIGSIDPHTGMPAALQPEVAPGAALPGNTLPNGALAGTTPSGNPSSARTVKPGKPNRLPTASVPGPKAKPKPTNAAPSQQPTAGPRVSPAHTAQGSSSKAEKVSKESVDYRPSKALDGRCCGTCSMFRRDDSGMNTGLCTLVEGDIRSDMVCDRWDAAPSRLAKGFDTKAALKELDLVRRQLKSGRSITDWQVKDLPQQVIDELRADLYVMDSVEAVMKARDSVYKLARARAGQGTADRESAITHVQSRVATDLRALCDGVENGKLSTADFLGSATESMRAGIRAGLQAGANAAVDQTRTEKRMTGRFQGKTWTNIVKDDGDEPDGYNDVLDSGTPYSDYLDQVASQEADRQSGYLSGLLQDILAAFGTKDWLDNLGSRLDLYAAQVRSAYEQGYGTTYAAMNPGGVIYTWYVTSGKPCKLCAARDGQQFSEDQLPGFPGQGGFGDSDIAGSELHLCMGGVNCFPGDTPVQAADIEQAYKRWYDGELVEIKTAEGRQLSGTPNHPVLTGRGWVPLGLLQEGDSLICGSFGQSTAIDPDVQAVPSAIEKVADALANAGSTVRAPVFPVDFHGDGTGSSKVDIVRANRELGLGSDASEVKPTRELMFTGADMGHESLSALRDTMIMSSAARLSPDGVVGACDHRGTLVATCDSPAGTHAGGSSLATPGNIGVGGPSATLLHGNEVVSPLEGFAQGAQFDAIGQQDALDGLSTPAVVVGHPVDGFPVEVTLDNLVSIKRRAWSGHVYNLETAWGWYVAGGIIAQNCKCYLSATTVPDGTGGGGLFKAARAAFSASLQSILGKAQAEEITQHDHGFHSHPDETHHVYAYLARHYPSDVLGWVKAARWRGPVEVKLSDISMKRRTGGARNPDKVRAIAHGIEDGHKIDPIVLVKVPGKKKYQIADGWHRTAGIEETGRNSAMAWVGEVDADSSFSAEAMGEASINYQRRGLGNH